MRANRKPAAEPPVARQPEAFYPLLCKNPEQSGAKHVLSADGRLAHPALPEEGNLITYSAKEVWHFENICIYEGQQTIWDSLIEVWQRLEESEAELPTLRRKFLRNPLHDDLDGHPELPPPTRKPIRREHVLLQLLLAYEASGVETGCTDLMCEGCSRTFYVRTALHQVAPVPSDVLLQIGFDDTAQFIASGFVTCPLCKRPTVPYFRW